MDVNTKDSDSNRLIRIEEQIKTMTKTASRIETEVQKMRPIYTRVARVEEQISTTRWTLGIGLTLMTIAVSILGILAKAIG